MSYINQLSAMQDRFDAAVSRMLAERVALINSLAPQGPNEAVLAAMAPTPWLYRDRERNAMEWAALCL